MASNTNRYNERAILKTTLYIPAQKLDN